MAKKRVVETTRNDEDYTLHVVKPNRSAQRKAQIEYNKAFREAVDSGAFLRKQLHKELEDSGVWTDDHEEKQKKILDKIRDKENEIREGGITLDELKQLGIELKNLRLEHRMLIAERNSEDLKTAESQAENARFYSLIVSCVLDDSNNPVFNSIDDYEENAEEEWAKAGVEELANMLYKVDSSYEDNLVENRWLRRYGIVDEQYYFVNEDGRRVDQDGRLIDDEGYYINEKGERVNKEGRPVDEFGDYLDAKPILDNDGNPIVLDDEEETDEKDTEE